MQKLKSSDIIARRQEILAYLAKHFTEREIAKALKVSQSTIHRDIQELKLESKDFVIDLVKYFGYYYQEAIGAVNQALREAWKVHHKESNPRMKLQALSLIINGSETLFNLLADGPTVLGVQKMRERLEEASKTN